MDTQEFTPIMISVVILSFACMSFFMGMMIHAAFMYEDKPNFDRNSRKAWVLCMIAGTGIMAWLFAYGYYANFM